MAMTGNYFVAPTMSALAAARKLAQSKVREFYRLKKHCLKLRWWPRSDGGDCGADLDWDWIDPERRIGELRIDEAINGHDNVRVIFFKANMALSGESFCRVWLLDAFQKKTQQLSPISIRVWRAHRSLIVERFYGGNQNA